VRYDGSVRRYLVLGGLAIAGCGTILSSGSASDTPDAGTRASPSGEDASPDEAGDGAAGDASADVDAGPPPNGIWQCPVPFIVSFEVAAGPSACPDGAADAGCTIVDSMPKGEPCINPYGRVVQRLYCTPCAPSTPAETAYMKSLCTCQTL
jgi:hypothetical protein